MNKKRHYLDTFLPSLLKVFFMLGLLFGASIMAKASEFTPFTVTEKDISDIYVKADGSSVETDELQTLVRSQLVVDKESQADIAYLSQFQTVEVLEAYTITPNGLKVPVSQKAIRTVDDDHSDSKSMFSDMKHRIIVFSNVTPGSRTYFKVVTRTHTPIFPGQFFLRNWFGAQTEWAHSEINITHDPKIKLQVQTSGLSGGRVSDGPQGEIRYRLSYQKPASRYLEPNQISEADVSPHVDVSSFKDQLDMAKAYEARAQDKYKVTPLVAKLANQITKGIADPKDQARALYNWVSKEIRYAAIYFGAGGVVPHYADDIIKNRYGDCKDKTTLLVALLNAKGIEASTVEISTSNSYALPKLAVFTPFNHVITYLPKWDLYVDPTAERALFGVLPYNELDKPTILTGLLKIGRTPKPSAKENIVSSTVQMKLNASGSITGISHTDYFGAEDIRARYRYEGADSSLGEPFTQDLLARSRLTGSGTLKPTDASDLEHPFSLDTTFNLDPIANVPGPGAITAPMGLAPREIEEIAFYKSIENPTQPAVCRSRTIVDLQRIEFPDNTKVTRVPRSSNYKDSDVEYHSSYTQQGNTVEVRRNLVIQHASMVCSVNEIKAWNKFLGVLQKDLRGQIFYE